MPNESIFILSAIINTVFVFFAARRGINWLLGSIVVNLILVGVFGAKLIEVFGLVTNAGNVFYACVFLATHFIVEKYGKRAALKTVAFGVGFLMLFLAMSHLTTDLVGSPLSEGVNTAMFTLFNFSIRVTFASILAYMFAQYVNVCAYVWLSKRTSVKQLWLRSNGANIIAQLVDSLLFFSIAFIDLPGPLLVQTILVGWLVKSVVVAMATPALYMNAYLDSKKS